MVWGHGSNGIHLPNNHRTFDFNPLVLLKQNKTKTNKQTKPHQDPTLCYLQEIYFVYHYLFAVLEIKPSASCIIHKCFITEVHSQPEICF
jgi:hypothetical protein